MKPLSRFTLIAVISCIALMLSACSDKPPARLVGKTENWEISLVESGYIDMPSHHAQFKELSEGRTPLNVGSKFFGRTPTPWLGLRLSAKLLGDKAFIGKSDCLLNDKSCPVFLGSPIGDPKEFLTTDARSVEWMNFNNLKQGQGIDLLFLISIKDIEPLQPGVPVRINLGPTLFGKAGSPAVELTINP